MCTNIENLAKAIKFISTKRFLSIGNCKDFADKLHDEDMMIFARLLHELGDETDFNKQEVIFDEIINLIKPLK